MGSLLEKYCLLHWVNGSEKPILSLKSRRSKDKNVAAGCELETWASPCLGVPRSKVLFGAGHGIHTTRCRVRSPLHIFGVSGPGAPLEGRFAFILHLGVGGEGVYRGARSRSEGQLKI